MNANEKKNTAKAKASKFLIFNLNHDPMAPYCKLLGFCPVAGKPELSKPFATKKAAQAYGNKYMASEFYVEEVSCGVAENEASATPAPITYKLPKLTKLEQFTWDNSEQNSDVLASQLNTTPGEISKAFNRACEKMREIKAIEKVGGAR